MFGIDTDSSVPPIKIKSHNHVANVKDLLEGSPFAGMFDGGMFSHYFLDGYSYHRFHAPVSGQLKEARTIPGWCIFAIVWVCFPKSCHPCCSWCWLEPLEPSVSVDLTQKQIYNSE